MADKKKGDYQEGLEKIRADSAARSRDSYMKDPEKSCVGSRESYMKDPEKSRESYKSDLEKSREDSAARSREHKRRNWGASARPISCYVLIKELTVIKDWYLTNYWCSCNVQYIISRF